MHNHCYEIVWNRDKVKIFCRDKNKIIIEFDGIGKSHLLTKNIIFFENCLVYSHRNKFDYEIVSTLEYRNILDIR